jgi:signal transduction histidine kinase
VDQSAKIEIKQIYHTWFQAYINGDVQTYGSYFDDDYRFIGSTSNEGYLNKKNSILFFEATAYQFSGKIDSLKVEWTISQYGSLDFITHFVEAYFLYNNTWDNYGRFRFSSGISKTADDYKFIYQHFLTPDSKADEGETIGFNVLTNENIQLKEAIKLRTAQLKQKNEELKNALGELKATQTQLIQSEKMASLGELTAGIAHEIQNPLNFVNNFSEVSNILIDEIQGERAKNIENRDEELVDEILGEIKQNLEKIIHHGKRADRIVKGMQQHSRASSGKKEPTDLNALADEYLRLAYHSLRAKDKSFNAQLVTDFDESIGKVGIITQDIGRVVLNLLTNAFYAVHEKAKENLKNFEPTVSISTKKSKDMVILEVKDNGNGIPNSVKEKIFQPFFTTKPTGQGTGLSLSMSYDIITKGHGGKLSIETNEGTGTTFSISLPL